MDIIVAPVNIHLWLDLLHDIVSITKSVQCFLFKSILTCYRLQYPWKIQKLLQRYTQAGWYKISLLKKWILSVNQNQKKI